jgi:DnaK suppressor protein
MMETVTIRKQVDRLKQRRDQLAVGLQHLAKEQDQLEQNTDWLDQAAFESRVNLLDHLGHWYLTEIAKIDKALDRIQRNQYGFCLACHDFIGLNRLETAPESEYCSSCQHMREALHKV